MAATTNLYFGSREYDAKTLRIAADRLRAHGYAMTERHVDGGPYIVETNAPREIALDAKRRARVTHEIGRAV